MHTIKKYSNRKLYFDGKYITLLDIVEMLKKGENIEVITHSDGSNVTESVLKEALVLLPLDKQELVNLIRKW